MKGNVSIGASLSNYVSFPSETQYHEFSDILYTFAFLNNLSNILAPEADVIEGLVVDDKCLVGVLNQLQKNHC